MRQCELQRIKGWFYLPEASDEKVPGILSWEPSKGATLELIGGFSPGPDYRENPEGTGCVSHQIVGDVRSGTIFGVSDSGTPLSIWEAQRGNYTAGMSGQVREEFWESGWVCVGVHIGSSRDPDFSKATLVLDELYYLVDDARFCPPQWAKIEGVDSPGELLENGTRLTPYILPVVGGYRAECVHAETDETRYSISTRATRPWASVATEAMPALKLDMMTQKQRRGQVIELHVGADASIRLHEGAVGSAADFTDRMGPVLDLIRLATFSTADVEAISLKTTGDEDVSLLSRIGEPANPVKTHEPAAVVFDFSDVSLDSYLKTWKKLTQGRQADYAWSVIVGHCGYSPEIVEQYVSQVLAAAEGFHTWCLNAGGAELNPRLKALHNMLPAEVGSRLNLDVDKWADWAVWARNHVAHGGSKRQRFIKDSLEILAVAKSVHLVTYLVVLCELGVPDEKICDALKDHPRLSAMVSYCEVVNQIHASRVP
ncbi:HEPN domain-containing protein [Rhodococcus sp. NPDC058521]|uniref:ApeA N-terminal domain 1-containing protein n=1 Tax=Rhodococcus sp. NPDC058521 TaxID=3346536 RepID=UPI0036546697